MLCVDCDYRCNSPCWDRMRLHYKTDHPEVKRPDKYYTKESRLRKKLLRKKVIGLHVLKIKKSKQKTKEVRSQKKIATVRKRR